jgi:hypothetical protein
LLIQGAQGARILIESVASDAGYLSKQVALAERNGGYLARQAYIYPFSDRSFDVLIG